MSQRRAHVNVLRAEALVQGQSPRDIFPARAKLDDMLTTLPSDIINSSIGVLDLAAGPFIFAISAHIPDVRSRGFPAHTHVAHAVLRAFTANPQLA